MSEVQKRFELHSEYKPTGDQPEAISWIMQLSSLCLSMVLTDLGC